MSLRLAERLNLARHRYFVGRTHESELFKTAISAPELPFSILYFFGTGGIGKTALLWQLQQICRSRQVPVFYLDSRNLEPCSNQFLAALQSVTQSSIEQLSTQSIRQVLLVDSYEQLAPLEDWLQSELFPQLPEQMLIVISSRSAPSSSWRIDLGWKALFQAVPLQNLSVEESQQYLMQRGIPEVEHSSIVEFSHGYPLALALMADLYEQDHNLNGVDQVIVTPVKSSAPIEPAVALSHEDFAKAVRDALRHYARPDVLHKNPLLRSRMVLEASVDRRSRIEALQSRLREATEVLQASPRDEKLYRALHRTYLHPALTQEQAAEALDLPFSTYRRHLKTGISRVADILWQREVLAM